MPDLTYAEMIAQQQEAIEATKRRLDEADAHTQRMAAQLRRVGDRLDQVTAAIKELGPVSAGIRRGGGK